RCRRALQSKRIGKCAIVVSCPDLAIGQRIKPWHRNANVMSGSAHAAFDHIAYSKLLRDLFKIARDTGFVRHDRGAADYFPVLDLGKIRQEFVLDSVSEEGVRLFLT